MPGQLPGVFPSLCIVRHLDRWSDWLKYYPIAYRVALTPVDHASCAEENDSSFPRPMCIYDWLGLVIARLLFMPIDKWFHVMVIDCWIHPEYSRARGLMARMLRGVCVWCVK